jgi:hypothetical protein
MPTAGRVCPFGLVVPAGAEPLPFCGERLVLVVTDAVAKNGPASGEEPDADRDESSDDGPGDP